MEIEQTATHIVFVHFVDWSRLASLVCVWDMVECSYLSMSVD